MTWLLIGAAATQLEPLALSADHVTKLLAQGRLELSEPLRWRGQLRADPLLLPWGVRYNLDLEEVQSAGTWMPVAGGMRVNYYYDQRTPQSPAPLRAGESIEALVRARVPRNYGDPGEFDYRSYLARQDVYLTATLRNRVLMERIEGTPPALRHRVRRLRERLLQEVDSMLDGSAASAAVARAMLLGDRSFIDREQADRFRETGVYHVLVLAGLHVGMLAALLLWVGRRLRWPLATRTLITLLILGAYVAIVEDRPPILRAALMITAYLLGRMMFRRTHALNALGVAALAILFFQPSALGDASFLLSFVAAGTIGGVAVPLLERTSQRYRQALKHLSDVTRDGAQPPQVTQFRLDVRAAAGWVRERIPASCSRFATSLATAPCHVALRLWEIMVLTLVIQIGILPLMALYFHRITLVGPLANVSAILLTAIIVPLGFVALSASLIWSALGHALGFVLAPFIGALVAWTDWFARFPWSSYRVPTPPWPLLAAFFAVLIVCSVESILAGDSEPLTADFLKIPHHGSRTSTTGEFLGAVGPRFVVVSVGESNPFGHPSPEVLERIESEGSRLYRTDRDGAITTLAGDKGMEVRAFLEQR